MCVHKLSLYFSGLTCHVRYGCHHGAVRHCNVSCYSYSYTPKVICNCMTVLLGFLVTMFLLQPICTSKLLQRYGTVDHRVKVLAVVLKYWAKVIPILYTRAEVEFGSEYFAP